MSNNKIGLLQNILLAPVRLVQYIWEAVSRIFSPSEDRYPTTGVQPFEGEPADDKKRHDW
ncbi:hypothetical protein Glo7428_3333 [Gloeocapsa sp. PCC 7428]|uniref:hypothetical protein n=1 Tax=Gloeocapsa sp. PCC 7428 TaxID=1173026 RepID=UPI0002A5BD5E|nr:hypothetical protein [Gloeocapsa sp. PCC 7428]AFZ31817.1 hypothetical protein Glo7428_3333 [Gloeocapsa sp. PCC 7428]